MNERIFNMLLRRKLRKKGYPRADARRIVAELAAMFPAIREKP